MIQPKRLQFEASKSSGPVSALLLRPDNAKWLYVFGHGAGAGMEHKFMEAMAQQLAEVGIATLRYNFPYMEQGRRSPSAPGISMATVRSAVAKAREEADDLSLLAGGKSYGGRMTSQAAAKEPLEGVKGLVFLGFPLHAPGRPGSERGAHLHDVTVPMLFLQGTRDKLADLTLLKPLLKEVGPKASLQEVEGGDHSFKVLKSAGRSEEEVMKEMAEKMKDWAENTR
ncbi:MAG: alpha/beta hydrolase family protein [Cyclobacteriaceae bacterium]